MSYPQYTRAERVADAVVHVLGVTSAVVGVYFIYAMFADRMEWPTFLGITVYAVALILMLSASAAYHMAAHTPARPILRRIDHAAIYLKIAATFTPLAILLNTSFGYAVLGLVWALALVGAVSKLLAARGQMTTGWVPQVALGWIGLALLIPLFTHLPLESVWYIAGGGLIYTGAVVFYCWDSLRFSNAIWHAFVLLATGCLFMGISTALAAALGIA
ncbi:MAG: hemolysin III family protein [Pseudomonadota bacterium]